jgi:hypothetical protein
MFNAIKTSLVVALAIMLASGLVQAADCGPTPDAGTPPLDYRTAPQETLRTVEKFHFTADVEALRRGQSSESIGRDLEFVLTYFPNHARALNALLRLAKREKSERPGGLTDSVDCWFDRAIQFRADDSAVRLLHALWLVHGKDRAAATQALEVARKTAPANSANYFYNLGLGYLEVGDTDRALEAAHRAYALGYPLPGLRERLRKLGKWKPAVEAPAVQQDAPAPVQGAPAGSPAR